MTEFTFLPELIFHICIQKYKSYCQVVFFLSIVSFLSCFFGDEVTKNAFNYRKIKLQQAHS